MLPPRWYIYLHLGCLITIRHADGQDTTAVNRGDSFRACKKQACFALGLARCALPHQGSSELQQCISRGCKCTTVVSTHRHGPTVPPHHGGASYPLTAKVASPHAPACRQRYPHANRPPPGAVCPACTPLSPTLTAALGPFPPMFHQALGLLQPRSPSAVGCARGIRTHHGRGLVTTLGQTCCIDAQCGAW